MTLKRIEMIADLDPAEEKLLAEAIFDTACEGLNKEDYDIDIPKSDENYENILPRSKVQFPIRRRRWTRCRKLLCFVVTLAFVLGVLGTTYSLLKSNTVSLDLKLVSGQTLQYKLEQESSFEGAKLARSSFSEDVIVQVVNKTGNEYWLKVKMNSAPHSAKHKLVFLVQVNLAGQKTMDIAGKKRFRVFSNSKGSEQVDYYVYNLLKQLLPVVKIDQFDMILSQLTTRTHQMTVHDTALFPGTATMQQTIRSVQGQILVSSKISPDGFSVFTKSRRDLPFVSLSFEEDVSISKATGMLQTSDMKLSAKIPLGEDDGPAVVMRFKSSLNFVEETSLSTPDKFETDGLVELPEIWSSGETRLKYFPPAYKRYDAQSNAINKVKQMLNLTKAEHFRQEEKPAHDKHMLEFANSFHQIVQVGQESHFAAVEGEKTERPSAGEKPHKHKTTNSGHGNNSANTRDGIDDDAPPFYDDDNNDDDDDYMGHVDPEDDGFERKRDKTAAANGEAERSFSSGHEANGNQDNNNNTAIQQTKRNPVHDSSLLTSERTKEAKNAKSKDNEKPSSKETTKSGTNKNTPSKEQLTKPTNTEEEEEDDEESPTSPDDHEENFFNQMFDRDWNDDEDNDDDEDDEFKFPPLPFGFTSNFPFIKFHLPSFESRKRRSLEPQQQPRARREKRDKRRLFGTGGETKHDNNTAHDLEAIWDVLADGTTKARPKVSNKVFKKRILGLEIDGELEHEVQLVTSTDSKDEWLIRLVLLLNVGDHQFKVLNNTYSMQEIESRFMRNSKPKLEYGTVDAGTLVLCSPLFYIEKICIEIQLGFVLHISHAIETIHKEYPVKMSIFFKHLAKVDAVLSSHMVTLLGSHGVYGHGAIVGVKIPLHVKFDETRRHSAQWCSIANLNSKIGHYYESWGEMKQWPSCLLDLTTRPAGGNCTADEQQHKPTKLWFNHSNSQHLHFLNNC